MKKLLLSALLAGLATQAVAENVFISEYIEGSSYNKAIEIYNGTGAAIDMSEYALALYMNGSSTPNSTITLAGTLADGDVYVVTHTSADALMLAVSDQSSGSLSFNGDDAVELQHNSTPIDVFGTPGDDPGSYWTIGAGSSQNHTLVRMGAVVEGTTDWTTGINQWDVYDSDTFDYLGAHTTGGVSNFPPTIANLTQTPELVMDGISVSVSATITDSDGTVDNVDFIYSVDGGTEVSTTLTGVADVYTGSIPGQLGGSEVAYRFEATDDDTDMSQSGDSYTVMTEPVLEAGDLVITEIMKDPSAVSDSNGEWFEIYNASGAQINLNGLIFTDDNYNTFAVDTDVFVDAGAYVLLANNGDNLTNGGLPTVDYVYPSDFYLGNGTDSVIIYDSYLVIDRVDYSDAEFPDDAGQSMALTDVLVDNNDGANWYSDSLHVYGSGDFGTPGAANDIAVDNPPTIENVVIAPEYVQPTDVVSVSADVSDDNSLTSVNLVYNVDETGDVTVPMTEARTYSASIPAQVEGSVVAWRIEATDDATQTAIYGPESYTVSAGLTTYTIAEIQAHGGDGVSLLDATMVQTSGIVCALGVAGGGSIFIQDGTGVLSGIQVYGGGNDFDLGDEVAVIGEVDEYFGQTELLVNVTGGSINVLTTGNAVYAPVELTADVACTEDYESMLVQIDGLTATGTFGDQGSFYVNDGSNDYLVDDVCFDFEPTASTCYDMAGVMMYTWSVFRLNPRGAMDLTYCGGGNMPPIIYGMEQDPLLVTDIDAVTVTAHAVDATAVSSVDLYYAIDGGAATSMAMSLVEGDTYEAVIPAQTDGAEVEYYVVAEDDLMVSGESAHETYTVSNSVVCDDISVVRVNDVDGTPLNEGESYTVCGLVTSASELGSSGPAYLSDATGSICAYGDLNGAVIGDEVTIVGTLGFYNGLTQMTSFELTVETSGNTVTPTEVTLAQLIADGEGYEASFVQVNGLSLTGAETTWPASSTVEVTDGTDVFNIFIDSSTDIDGAAVPEGEFDLLAVIGQYDNDDTDGYFAGYQLLPRMLTDIITGSAEPECSDLADLRVNDENGEPVNNGQEVKVCGIVTSTNQLGYNGPTTIQTETGAIAIYDGSVSSDSLIALGDSIEVIGTLTSFRGLTQVGSVSSFVIVNNGPELLGEVITLTQLVADPESYESRLITLQGVELVDPENWPAESSSVNLTITDGTDTFTLRIDADTDIDGMPVPAGAFDLTAVIGQYDSSSPYTEGYQLLPRFQTDIVASQGLPAPVVNIAFATGQVTLSWDTVPGAVDYKVYTCVGDPYEAANWDAGQSTFGLTMWTISSPTGKEFYRVTAE